MLVGSPPPVASNTTVRGPGGAALTSTGSAAVPEASGATLTGVPAGAPPSPGHTVAVTEEYPAAVPTWKFTVPSTTEPVCGHRTTNPAAGGAGAAHGEPSAGAAACGACSGDRAGVEPRSYTRSSAGTAGPVPPARSTVSRRVVVTRGMKATIVGRAGSGSTAPTGSVEPSPKVSVALLT